MRKSWGALTLVATVGFHLVLACGKGSATAERVADAGGAAQAGAAGIAEKPSDVPGGAAGSGPMSSGSGARGACPIRRCEAGNCTELMGEGSCEAPLRLFEPGGLQGGRVRLNAVGSTACGFDRHHSANCAAFGSELSFELDLRQIPGPIDVWAELDADIDMSLHLEQGDCEDPVVVGCNEDHTPGVARSVLISSVDSGRYRLIVDSEEEDAEGNFRLVVTFSSASDLCLAAPENDTCAGALDLDPELAVQTVVGSTRCAYHDAYSFYDCHVDDVVPDVFYRLDLRERTQPVVMFASTDLPPTNFKTVLYVMDSARGECFAPIACSDQSPSHDNAIEGASELVAELAPAEYFLVVDGWGTTGDFGLRVSLDELSCSTNDTCESALELDASSGEHVVQVNVACADFSRITSCARLSPGPDVFYRLDLSEYTTPVRLRADAQDGLYSLAVLAEAPDGGCGNELFCGDEAFSMVLQPKAYYLLISTGSVGTRGRTLSLDIEPLAASALDSCIDTEVARCADDLGSCCDAVDGTCLYAFSACNLDPELQSCVCEAAPDCCERPLFANDCADAVTQCGLYCPEFDMAAFCGAAGR